MDQPTTTLQYEAAEVMRPDRLSSTEIGALRLGAALWLVAAAIFTGVHVFAKVANRGSDWPNVFRSLFQPNIVGASWQLPYWNDEPLATILSAFSAIGWIAACWLLSETTKERNTSTSRLVRIAALITAAAGAAWSFLPWEWQRSRWALLVTNTDVILALAVALHLRWASRFINSVALDWMARRMPWLIAADLMLTLLITASVSEVAARMRLALDAMTAVYSALLIAVMIVLTRLRLAADEQPSINLPPA